MSRRRPPRRPPSSRAWSSDRGGKPLAGAVVSAIGSESAFAVSDREGRFTFRTLPPGPYIVRAHLQGYLPARPRLMQISTSAAGRLHHHAREAVRGGRHAGGARGRRRAVDDEPIAEARRRRDPRARRAGVAAASSETQRAQEQGERVPGLDTTIPADNPLFGLGRAVGESARLASSILADLPLDGQFNLLTTTSFDRPQDLFSPDAALPRSIAFVSLSAPMANGEWRMRGAMTQGDLSSWTVAGSYARADPRRRTPTRRASRTACSATRAATPRRWRRCATAAARWACCTPTTTGR